MPPWITHLVASLGYTGVGLLMAIENVVLPIPSELIMPLAGFLAARGRMTLWGVVLVGTIGSVVGALPVYYAARLLGQERVRDWIARHGRWLLIRRDALDRPHRWFERHGAAAVGFGQLVPGVRGLISLPAGFARMNVLAFAFWNFVGTVVWCTVLAWLGALLGRHYAAVHRYVAPAGWALLGVLLLGGAWWVLRRRARRAHAR